MEHKSLDVMKFKLSQPALIEASAGTGKTYTITNLVLRILLGSGDQNNSLERPLAIENLLVVTFTRVATSDLRRRIYERIRMAHVLFENFLEVAQQEIKKKAHELASSELKVAQKAVKTVAKLQAQEEQGEIVDKAKVAELEGQSSVLSKLDLSLSEEELVEQFCERFIHDSSFAPNLSEKLAKFQLNVEAIARDKLNCDDDFLIQLLKQIADKDAIKPAIAVLTRAERSIDDAAICTIHSFCNRMLTQIYAFEANEAFSNELSNDLSLQFRDAANTVWRKLFYKLSATPAVLKLLDITSPNSLDAVNHIISSVHLSQEQAGVFGYELLNFKLPGLEHTFDIAQNYDLDDVSQRMFYRAEIIETAKYGMYFLCYMRWREKYFSQVGGYINLQDQTVGELLFDGKNKDFGNEVARKFVKGLTSLEQAFQKVKITSELEELLNKNEELTSKFLSNTDFLASDELKFMLKSFQQVNVTSFVADSGLINAVIDVIASKLDISPKMFLLAANKKLVKTPEYLEFHKHLVELGSSLRKIQAASTSLRPILSVLLSMQINQQLQDYCIEHHLMSNDDLLRRLDQALQRPGFGDRLAHLIRMRYPLAMIDEFQDTDPIQYSIFSKIYLNPTAIQEKAYCYLIGDPKQSIYAFRGSDINSYLKARKTIHRLTKGQGISTLNVNYRSTDDVINACNALFDTTLNPENASPFKELDITFAPVGAHKKRKSAEEVVQKVDAASLDALPVDSAELAKAWGSSFVLENMQELGLLASEQDQSSAETGKESNVANDANEVAKTNESTESTETKETTAPIATNQSQPQLKQALANTYVVRIDDSTANKEALQTQYAQAAALLVQQMLKDGKILEKGEERAVKPSDIALLVRSQAENDLLQSALRSLGISSVYFSDRSSVLTVAGEPTQESQDILYLMEAMSDPANRSKVMRILGSGLLSLSTEEFLEHSSGLCFEREVLCLKNCSQIWDKYGFMPAFLQWCADPDHQVTSRLLSIINGERALTNYNQISELIQGVHNQHASVKAQIRWFYDLLHSGLDTIDAESAQKRLDSEHEQIKILTIHKSKGLEFPIVLMPFLWTAISQNNSNSKSWISNIARYYSHKVEQRVVDFDNNAPIIVPNVEKLALDKLKRKQSASHVISYDHEEFESELSKAEGHKLDAVVDESLADGSEQATEQEQQPSSKDNHEQGLAGGEVNSDRGDSASGEQTSGEQANGLPFALNMDEVSGDNLKQANTIKGVPITQCEVEKQDHSSASPKSLRPYLFYTPKGFEMYEDAKERMRLLYVAVTRARLANFFFIGNFQPARKGPSPSSLMELLGVQEVKGMDLSSILEPLERNRQLFTMIDGKRCLDLFKSSVENLHVQASNLTLSSYAPELKERMAKLQAQIDELMPEAKEQGRKLFEEYKEQHKFNRKGSVPKKGLPFRFEGNVPLEAKLYDKICNLRQEIALLQVNNVPVLDHSRNDTKLESCAMSFAYEGAIDHTFNIMSYSRITSGHDPIKKAQQGQPNLAKRNEEEDGAIDVQGATVEDGEICSLDPKFAPQESSEWINEVQATGVGGRVGGNFYHDYEHEAQVHVAKMQNLKSMEMIAQNYTLNEYMQHHWDANQVGIQGKWKPRPSGLNFNFPCGAEPGTFLHESLRYVNFDEIQTTELSKEEFFGRKLKEKITMRSDLGPIFRKAKLDVEFTRFSDWLVNMVEAPIIKGHHQYLALADLQANNYVSEMNFLMTSRRFDTRDIDALCQDMAYKILPKSMHGIIGDLVLSQDELFGFITGSLDLACRFDLNYQGDLKFRPDLLNELTHQESQAFAAMAAQESSAPPSHEPDLKYYVIDYKSNILGNEFENYSTQNMLQAIYSHRYDVQFLFYTLAMFRVLKRRMALGFDADEDEQRKFYDANMGGVIYMYLRGLKGDYLRRGISPGVFSIKIDFEFVHRLDKIFGADEEWS